MSEHLDSVLAAVDSFSILELDYLQLRAQARRSELGGIGGGDLQQLVKIVRMVVRVRNDPNRALNTQYVPLYRPILDQLLDGIDNNLLVAK